jgi:hypothetical protein
VKITEGVGGGHMGEKKERGVREEISVTETAAFEGLT